ncbi:PDDEXK family nuclease [Paenibacillus zanthoxyli]|uniref:hypothetical protein n=1 Tax=Paenibacillus zanthoxyli TaxID=369399 RepID=UPI0004702BBB|nr:hypothetical protein [Paenibacillus zanthoxyli]
MEWKNRIWVNEDNLYSPKRKVNNRRSHFHPHIIGSFFSQKNLRPVEYESLSERLFYYYLELDSEVIRYYVQPIEVPIYDGKEEWIHIPDVLVFKQRFNPLLYQVKLEPEETPNEHVEICNRYCRAYVLEENWEYHVIYPKELPETLSYNLRLLKGFLKERKYYPQWCESINYRLCCIESCSIENLASTFTDAIDPLLIKPLIFHLIAKGTFLTDVNEKITSQSIITFNYQSIASFAYIQGGT